MQLAQLSPVRSVALPLAGGDRGTAQTIRQIRAFVDQGVKDPAINRLAVAIARATPAYNDEAKVRAIYDWVHGNIAFVKDIVGKETLRTARLTLELRAGDCDDINAILLPTLLGTIGYRTRLVTVATEPSSPTSFSHVYTEVWLNGRWIPLDAARPGSSYGQAPARVFRKKLWSLSDDTSQEIGQGRLSNIFAQLPQISRSATEIIATLRAPRAALAPALPYLYAPPYGPSPPGTIQIRGPQGGGFALEAPSTSTIWLIGGAIGLFALMMFMGGRR